MPTPPRSRRRICLPLSKSPPSAGSAPKPSEHGRPPRNNRPRPSSWSRKPTSRVRSTRKPARSTGTARAWAAWPMDPAARSSRRRSAASSTPRRSPRAWIASTGSSMCHDGLYLRVGRLADCDTGACRTASGNSRRSTARSLKATRRTVPQLTAWMLPLPRTLLRHPRSQSRQHRSRPARAERFELLTWTGFQKQSGRVCTRNWVARSWREHHTQRDGKASRERGAWGGESNACTISQVSGCMEGESEGLAHVERAKPGVLYNWTAFPISTQMRKEASSVNKNAREKIKNAHRLEEVRNAMKAPTMTSLVMIRCGA